MGAAPQWSLWLVWSGTAPTFVHLAPVREGHWILGRDTRGIDDSRASRRHCQVEQSADHWRFTDLGSANGTYVDRQRSDPSERPSSWNVLLFGRSLVIPLRVGDPASVALTHAPSVHVGPGLRPTWEAICGVAARSHDLVVVGPPGAAFEGLAEHYRSCLGGGRLTVVDLDRPTPPSGRVPPGVVLASGLEEPRAYMGHPWIAALRGRSDLHWCLVIERWDREPRPSTEGLPPGFEVLTVPSLGDRREEIPWWIVDAVASVDDQLGVDVTLVESCLDEHWPGGVDELVSDVRDAARRARAAGAKAVRAKHVRQWSPVLGVEREIIGVGIEGPSVHRARRPVRDLRDRDVFAALLRAADHDPEKVAIRLAIPTEAVLSWIRRHRLDKG